MKKLSRILMGGLLVLLAATAGFGEESKQEPSKSGQDLGEQTPEHGKLNTADASPVEPGSLDVEFGYGYTWAKNAWDRDGKSRSRGLREEHSLGLTRSNFPWGVTVGVFQDFDLSLGLEYLWLFDGDQLNPTRGQGMSDLGLGARYRFLNWAEYHLEAAYIVGLTIPTGNSADGHSLGTSQDFWSWENVLVVTKDWGSWTANADLGYSLPFGEKRGPARGTFSANLALGYQIFPWLQPEVELNYTRDFATEGDPGENLAVTAGLVLPINDLLRVNLGVQHSIWGRNSDQGTGLLLTVKLAF
ncbi:MAG: transporter [Deltaproteobacteria bacterium]|nr:transporter [Deltaproteobacteria bacterium]